MSVGEKMNGKQEEEKKEMRIEEEEAREMKVEKDEGRRG